MPKPADPPAPPATDPPEPPEPTGDDDATWNRLGDFIKSKVNEVLDEREEKRQKPPTDGERGGLLRVIFGG